MIMQWVFLKMNFINSSQILQILKKIKQKKKGLEV